MLTAADITWLVVFFIALFAGSLPAGRLIAGTFADPDSSQFFRRNFLERFVYRLSGIDPDAQMDWRCYARALVIFNLLGGLVVLFLQLLQAHLPLNPQELGAVPTGIAVNTAVSFLTNTNWQAYSGETMLGNCVQMLGLGVQNFLSAATGLAVFAAFTRGLRRHSTHSLGNFYSDVVRGTLLVLLPASALLAVILMSQGTVMSFEPNATVTTLDGAAQIVPLGPAASQIAIKQLGTNGGGFFGVNSAHPFENPTPFANLLETLAILILPAGCVLAYGRLTGARRHAVTLYAVMLTFFITALGLALWSEMSPATGAAQFAAEGKEVRFGVVPSIVWSTATTVASNGSVNAMHSSLSPLAGGVAMFNMALGEIIFGGIGSGIYGMAMLVILTVFLAGLMVGRTPEYLGKKNRIA